MTDSVKTYLKSFTIEPILALKMLGVYILYGTQVETNLLIWKLCHFELGYSEKVCQNLSLETNEQVENLVQKRLQEFQTIGQWINSVPTLILSLFMGSISEKFGRKPLMIFPLVGSIFANISLYFNYRFISILPLQLFYLNACYNFLGGSPIYYLGVYTYGADVSSESGRASRLSRFGGVEMVAMLLGVILSSVIFEHFGYYGSFSFALAPKVLAVLYLIFFIKETSKSRVSKINWSLNGFLGACVSPLKELLITVFKKRPDGLRSLIFIQILNYSLFFFTLEQFHLEYVYMLKAFPGFNGVDYSYYSIFVNIRDAFGHLVLIPFLSSKLGIDDCLLTALALVCECLAYLTGAFATNLWQYYLSQGLVVVSSSKYALARAIMSKCVVEKDVSQMFASMSIVAAVTPLASNPAFRTFYSSTLEIFPAAFMLLASSISLVGAVSFFHLHTQKHRLTCRSHDKNPVYQKSTECKH